MDPERKRRAKIWNERVKLLAGACDRASTVILAGGVLGPLFQDAAPRLRAAYWIVAALVLHLLGQFVLGRMKEEG